MSDIGFAGVLSFMVGVGFLGLAAVLVAPVLGVTVYLVVKKRALVHPAILGLGGSVVTLAGAGVLALVSAEHAPRATDDSVVYWGPAALLCAVGAGVGAALVSAKGRPRSR